MVKLRNKQGGNHALSKVRGGSPLCDSHQAHKGHDAQSAQVSPGELRARLGNDRGDINRTGAATNKEAGATLSAAFTIARQARLLAAIHEIRKAKIDPEKLRAQLQAMYRKEFRREAREAIAEAIEAVRDIAGPVDSSDVELVMSTLGSKLGAENIGTTLVSRSTTVVRDVFRSAAGDIRAGYKITVTDHEAIKLLNEQNLIWIKDHFDDDLMPKFRDTVTDVMQTGYSRRRLAEQLADELGDIVDADTDYWETLADHTVTKARSVGRLAAIEEAGINKIVIVAQMDGRTSAICRNMNGRVIDISVARAQVNALKAAKTREDLENAMTWLKEMPGKTADLQSAAGNGKHFALPPYHYRCRTDYDAYFQETTISMQYGDKIRNDDKNFLDKYSADEHWRRAQGIVDQAKHPNGLSWDDGDWKHDVKKALFVKHGVGDFGDDVERYFARSQETVMNADEITVKIYRPKRKGSVPRMQYTYYSRTTDAMVVVDDNGLIRGCYITEDLDQTVAGQARKRLWLKRKKD